MRESRMNGSSRAHSREKTAKPRQLQRIQTAAGCVYVGRPSARKGAGIDKVDLVSYVLVVLFLGLALPFKLLGSLLAGLLVFQLVQKLAPALEKRMPGPRARLAAVAFLAAIITGVVATAVIAGISQFQHSTMSVQNLLDQLMQVVDKARAQVPDWVMDYLPDGEAELRDHGLTWVKAHVSSLQQGGKNVILGIVRAALGMIIGAMIAVGLTRHVRHRPLASALILRIQGLSETFERIVFAQVKISLINTACTGMYLVFILPLFHERLPLTKTLILVTFLCGLLPVIGNLISNTLITVISLASSVSVAVYSLIFLIVIHKLEYFLNARIIGGQIAARAWELLLAMLIMESIFGLSGVVAAPIYYAYFKRELVRAKWV